MSAYRAMVNCYDKRITLTLENGDKVIFAGDMEKSVLYPRNHKKKRRSLEVGLVNVILALDLDVGDSSDVRYLPIIRNFLDIFLDELPRLPAHLEVDFSIEVYLGTEPIHLPSYKIAPAEMAVFHEQLDEFLALGFI